MKISKKDQRIGLSLLMLEQTFVELTCRGANLRRAVFDGADLEGADLSGADLRRPPSSVQI